MNASEIIAISVGSITLLAAILGGLLWLIRAQVALQREFKPNGGSSTRDALNRIESEVKDVRSKIDDHVTYHLNNDL
jgi:hypothetical protein